MFNNAKDPKDVKNVQSQARGRQFESDDSVLAQLQKTLSMPGTIQENQELIGLVKNGTITIIPEQVPPVEVNPDKMVRHLTKQDPALGQTLKAQTTFKLKGPLQTLYLKIFSREKTLIWYCEARNLKLL